MGGNGSFDPHINMGRKPKRKDERPPADLEAMFAREDWVRWHYRDTGDQSWRSPKTRRGRLVE